jgi:CMP-N-acetylneuraminic acid synthetase
MKIVSLLPMKGHSERIPNKNLRLLDGKPLFHYIAETLESSTLISKIIIDTDSKEIAENALKNFSKVEIIDRPSELQGDLVPMNDIIAYDISHCQSEHFLQTHSTNPLLTRKTLEEAIEAYFENIDTYDSLFSVTKLLNRFYLQSGEPVNHNSKELLRTQDLPPLFEENSNIYIFSKKSFSTAGNQRIGLKPYMFKMNKLEAIDIDDEEDFLLAETLLKARLQK